MVPVKAVLPDAPFGPDDRYPMRDTADTSRRDRAEANKFFIEMLNIFSPEIRCQFAGTEEDELRILRGRGDQAVAEFQAIEAARLTEEECQGDVDPVLYAVYDTTLSRGRQIVAAYHFYNIVFTSRSTLTMRPWAVFFNFLKLGMPLNEAIGFAVDVVEIFLSGPGLDIDGTIYQVEALKTFTTPNPILEKTRLDGPLEAWATELDQRGADPSNALQVETSSTAWGGVERRLTWTPL